MAVVIIVCGTLVVLAVTAAVTVTLSARAALAKAAPEDVPEVLARAGELLEGFCMFVPHRLGRRLEGGSSVTKEAMREADRRMP